MIHHLSNLSPQYKGILCLLGSVAVLTASDSIIKWLSLHYALYEIMLFRALVALGITFVIIYFEGGFQVLRTCRPLLHVIRAFLMVLANMCFFLGAAAMPLADAAAIFFSTPLFICVLSIPILGERVGPWRWVAIFIGLIGVVVMLRPGTGSLSLVGLLPLTAAFAYACMQMLTKKLGMQERASTMAFYLHMAFIVTSVTAGLAFGDGKFHTDSNLSAAFLLRAWSWPTDSHWLLILLCGTLVGIGMYLLSQAYRIGSASVVAPFEYAAMPFAVFWGFQLWGDFPDAISLIGGALIIGSGLVILFREKNN